MIILARVVNRVVNMVGSETESTLLVSYFVHLQAFRFLNHSSQLS